MEVIKKITIVAVLIASVMLIITLFDDIFPGIKERQETRERLNIAEQETRERLNIAEQKCEESWDKIEMLMENGLQEEEWSEYDDLMSVWVSCD